MSPFSTANCNLAGFNRILEFVFNEKEFFFTRLRQYFLFYYYFSSHIGVTDIAAV